MYIGCSGKNAKRLINRNYVTERHPDVQLRKFHKNIQRLVTNTKTHFKYCD